VVILLNGIALRSSLARPLRATWPFGERSALLLAYAAGLAAAHGIAHVLPSPAALPLSLGAGALAYTGTFLAAGALNDRDRRRLREAAEIARSWRAGRGAVRLSPRGDAISDGRVERDALTDPAARRDRAGTGRSRAAVQVHVEDLEVVPGEAGE
jgi:hypothetical protein